MRVGRKHLEVATKWIPSAVYYGAAASLTLVYFTDWKIVVKYIPFYGSKFNN
ncbi:hypothetical protein WH47_03483 [Habropoda laboriosa]|uniref:Cytochrome b-c1 complex subunit 10 n=1 Tax=Habropoda laboriosa TaxID=597456 RepID=A0A0L7RBY8_9HYME|nr:hypothetical protein WH47_03483 [Habropoda laboriosa]